MQTDPNSATFDNWFRAKVQEALDDPRPAIPNDAVEARFAARRIQARGGVTKAQSPLPFNDQS